MKLRDKYGWPLELFDNRPFINFLRRVKLTNIIATWRYRNWDGTGVDPGPISELRKAWDDQMKHVKPPKANGDSNG